MRAVVPTPRRKGRSQQAAVATRVCPATGFVVALLCAAVAEICCAQPAEPSGITAQLVLRDKQWTEAGSRIVSWGNVNLNNVGQSTVTLQPTSDANKYLLLVGLAASLQSTSAMECGAWVPRLETTSTVIFASIGNLTAEELWTVTRGSACADEPISTIWDIPLSISCTMNVSLVSGFTTGSLLKLEDGASCDWTFADSAARSYVTLGFVARIRTAAPAFEWPIALQFDVDSKAVTAYMFPVYSIADPIVLAAHQKDCGKFWCMSAWSNPGFGTMVQSVIHPPIYGSALAQRNLLLGQSCTTSATCAQQIWLTVGSVISVQLATQQQSVLCSAAGGYTTTVAVTMPGGEYQVRASVNGTVQGSTFLTVATMTPSCCGVLSGCGSGSITSTNPFKLPLRSLAPVGSNTTYLLVVTSSVQVTLELSLQRIPQLYFLDASAPSGGDGSWQHKFNSIAAAFMHSSVVSKSPASNITFVLLPGRFVLSQRYSLSSIPCSTGCVITVRSLNPVEAPSLWRTYQQQKAGEISKANFNTVAFGTAMDTEITCADPGTQPCGFDIAGAVVIFAGVSFARLNAAVAGGAIAVTGASTLFASIGNLFLENQASNGAVSLLDSCLAGGGDIYATDGADVVIVGCVSESSRAPNGGSVLITDGATLFVSDSVFDHGEADYCGGLIAGCTADYIHITDSVFRAGIAQQGGCIALANHTDSAVLSFNQFSDCFALQSGGGVLVNGTQLHTANNSFVSCVAHLRGSGMFCGQSAYALDYASSFQSGSAANVYVGDGSTARFMYTRIFDGGSAIDSVDDFAALNGKPGNVMCENAHVDISNAKVFGARDRYGNPIASIASTNCSLGSCAVCGSCGVCSPDGSCVPDQSACENLPDINLVGSCQPCTAFSDACRSRQFPSSAYLCAYHPAFSWLTAAIAFCVGAGFVILLALLVLYAKRFKYRASQEAKRPDSPSTHTTFNTVAMINFASQSHSAPTPAPRPPPQVLPPHAPPPAQQAAGGPQQHWYSGVVQWAIGVRR